MATPEKTYLFSEKFENVKYKKLGKTGFQSSVCGFGTYRVDYRVKEHNEALEFALQNGINLIDTAANYSDGGSETLVGTVLTRLTEENRLERDEVIVVSKGGYIQGENLRDAMQREAEGRGYPEMVKCAPDLWHCIHPDFLSDQITHSLERMKLDKIDCYLLHNPEYFLSYTNTSDLPALRKEYYRRICEAFIHLEGEVIKGRICYYGISSNTFTEDSRRWNYTSIDEIFNIVRDISPDNHFGVIELPLNLLEKEAAQKPMVPAVTDSLLDKAYKAGLGVLVNRPLNAIENNKIVRLADFPIRENRTPEEINQLIEELQQQEESIKNEFVKKMEAEGQDIDTINESLSLSVILKSTISRFESANQFIEIKKTYLIPRANFAINEIFTYYKQDEQIADKLNFYATIVNIVLDSIESMYAVKTNEANRKYHDMLSEYTGPENDKLTLSQKVFLMINSLSEVSCTLVGMRSREYVLDVLKVIGAPSVENAKEYWEIANENKHGH